MCGADWRKDPESLRFTSAKDCKKANATYLKSQSNTGSRLSKYWGAKRNKGAERQSEMANGEGRENRLSNAPF
jgi:hypothetical protein